MRPAITGPCNASPVHRSLGACASNRPNTRGGFPSGRVVSSRRAKWRCNVRADGVSVPWAARIAATWAAVRAGFSRFNATANSRVWAQVRGFAPRGGGTSAWNPPARHARIQRSSVTRETCTRAPNGPACSASAIPRTMAPRARGLRSGSAAWRIRA